MQRETLPAGQLAGVTASPGIATGRAARLTVAEIKVPRDGETPAREAAALDRAIDEVRRRIGAASNDGDTVRGAIMAAHLAFLDDEAPAVELPDDAPEVLLIGTGPRQVFLRPDVLRPLLALGIGIETMTTQAAARTYNILMSEERRVLALLLPGDPS